MPMDTRPLLNPSTSNVQEKGIHEDRKQDDGVASILASSFNLANTQIGLGTVTIPFAFRNTGVLPGIVLLILVILAGNHSYRSLARCSLLTGKFSFKEVAEDAFGGRFGGHFTTHLAQILVGFYATGSCIAYIRVFGDYLPHLLQLVFPTAAWLPSDKLCMVFITLLICLPMAAQKTLEKLKFASILAIFGISFTIVALSTELFHLGVAADINWTRVSATTCLAFPLLSVANTGHHNMLRLYHELKNRESGYRTAAFVGISNVICFTFYTIVGLAGYLALGNFTPGNVLLGYDSVICDKHVDFFYYAIQFAKLFLLIAIACSFPMPHFAVRSSIEAVCCIDNVSARKRWALTTGLVGVMLGVALFVPGITDVFDVSGSTVGMIMVYIMPCIFIMRLEFLQQIKRGASSNAMFAFAWCIQYHWISILVMLFGVTMSVWLFVWAVL